MAIPAYSPLLAEPVQVTPGMRKAAFQALERLGERWSLPRADLALLVAKPARTVRSWLEHDGGAADADVLERISHLIGIYDALHRLFGDSPFADEWVHRNNSDFAGAAPIALLRSGRFTALVEVRRYLEQALAR